MLPRCLFIGVVGLLLAPVVTSAADDEGAKVLDRFVGAWRNDVSRLGPAAPERRKLTTNEVVAEELKGRFLLGREMNPQSGGKTIWFWISVRLVRIGDPPLLISSSPRKRRLICLTAV